jgi:hypothetical protein
LISSGVSTFELWVWWGHHKFHRPHIPARSSALLEEISGGTGGKQ